MSDTHDEIVEQDDLTSTEQDDDASSMKPYKVAYQSQYLEQNQKYGICEDCKQFSLLIETGACSDFHLYNFRCCPKYTCLMGCVYACSSCTIPNNIMAVDGCANSFECYACHARTQLNTVWYGSSITMMCERYCGCNLSKWNGVVYGIKVRNADTSDIWCDECGYCDGADCAKCFIVESDNEDTSTSTSTSTHSQFKYGQCVECEHNRSYNKTHPRLITELDTRDRIQIDIDFELFVRAQKRNDTKSKLDVRLQKV